jgi:hypothetical protein
MATNNAGLSAKATKQLERMIDDAAIVTYPMHLIAGIIKDLLFILFLISAVIVYTLVWMFTAHDNRAELTKNFVAEQSVYRVDLAANTFADNAVTVHQTGQLPVLDSTLQATFDGCMGTGERLRNPMWTDRDWLAEKSDVFQSAYIAVSHNLAALKVALHRSKEPFQPVYSFHYACTDAMGWKSPVVIPNAPVVYMSMLERTDGSPFDPAHVWYTGMCLANCTDADFVPRNDSIYADLIAPQVTANQGAALKTLNATGTPEFWIAAAHANGIYGHDAEFADYAEMQKAQLARDLSHVMTPDEETAREFAVAGIGCVLFVSFIGVWIARRIYN